jgi:hypothetical protein
MHLWQGLSSPNIVLGSAHGGEGECWEVTGVRTTRHTTCQMCPLTGKAGSPCLLPSRPQRIFRIGGTLRSILAGAIFSSLRVFCHITFVLVTAAVIWRYGPGKVIFSF